MMTILSVAYPFAMVGPDSIGGAEQVLTHIDEALVLSGERSLVIAARGSSTRGTLIPISQPRTITDATRKRLWTDMADVIRETLARDPVDVVHMHGADFHCYLPDPGVPVLATLHMPPSWYPPEIFVCGRPQTYLQCVSASQRSACPASAHMLPEICNGVPIEMLGGVEAAKDHVLMLGRICQEKGFHRGLVAATLAGVPALLGGRIYPYPEHEAYFRNEIRPRLDDKRRFVGALGFARKRHLLTAARCLLVTSSVPETSSLVAMEALACGTPVVAFRVGALPELIEDAVTGFLVNDEYEMANAIRAVDSLSRDTCRAVARERFSRERMTGRYLELYRQIVKVDGSGSRWPHAA